MNNDDELGYDSMTVWQLLCLKYAVYRDNNYKHASLIEC